MTRFILFGFVFDDGNTMQLTVGFRHCEIYLWFRFSDEQ
jgi:hypothetical protein